ncbi:MAG: hypothetical protein N3A54_05850 [Patescibacteria group bacterium]|nr:hypothetical protein [Patescibacteria group bacterium]
MTIDPYYENMTAWGKIKKQIIAAWPTIYRLTNGLVSIICKNLYEMIKSAIKAIKP